MSANSPLSVSPSPPDVGDAPARDRRCPLCGGENGCRVANGLPYKGPCWCQEIIVPNHVLTRLAAERTEPACLCRPCLETVAQISREDADAEAILARVRESISQRVLSAGTADYYFENGNMVFTAAHHLKRGHCCDSGCRHCPY